MRNQEKNRGNKASMFLSLLKRKRAETENLVKISICNLFK